MNSPNLTEEQLAQILKRSHPRTVRALPPDYEKLPELRGPRGPRGKNGGRTDEEERAVRLERQRAKRAAAKVSEHSHQVAVLQFWAVYSRSKGLDERLLAAIPNGGARNAVTGAMLKTEGVRRGFPDLFLAIPHPAFAGMFIELKTEGRRVSIEQREYADLLRRQDYNVITAFGADEAIRAITAYVERALA